MSRHDPLIIKCHLFYLVECHGWSAVLEQLADLSFSDERVTDAVTNLLEKAGSEVDRASAPNALKHGCRS